MAFYVAYGSNLHPLRLRQRLGAVVPLARVRISGARVVYRKRGQDGSGKCDLVPATGTGFGVLYRLDSAQLALLDRYEGGYGRTPLQLMLGGEQIEALTYRALPAFIAPGLPPLAWYQALVIAGCGALGFDPSYAQALAAAACVDDPDSIRATKMAWLVAALNRHRIAALRQLPWGEAQLASIIS